MTVNISSLKEPEIIEALSYEDILSDMTRDFLSRDPDYQYLLESDPALKILEVAAWRELILRQRVNNAARSNLLAFSKGTDLEHLAAFYDVTRLEDEDDISLRRRIQEKITGWSTAGSRAHYRFHALSADVQVRDARADSPELGRVRVAVLSTEGDGLPSEALLAKVEAKVKADDVRVLTDTVDVVPCKILPVDVVADIYLYPETQISIMDQIKQSFLQKVNETRGLGWDLTRSWVIAHLFLEGVQHVDLKMPVKNIVAEDTACIAVNSVTLKLAGRDR